MIDVGLVTGGAMFVGLSLVGFGLMMKKGQQNKFYAVFAVILILLLGLILIGLGLFFPQQTFFVH